MVEMSGKSILLVEEDARIAPAEQNELKRRGYSVTHARTGGLAVRAGAHVKKIHCAAIV